MKQLIRQFGLPAIFTLLIGIFALPLTAKAATDILPSDITINYESEDITITSDYQANKIYYTDKFDSKRPEKTEWDFASTKSEGGKKTVVIDISWLKKGNSIIYIKSDATNATIYPIAIKAEEKTLAAFYSGTSEVAIPKGSTTTVTLTNTNSFTAENSGYIYFTIVKGDKSEHFTELSKLEWKKGLTGKWNPYDKLNISWYINKGAVLYFRIKGVDSTKLELKDGKYITDGNRASKEVKVTIPRVKNAPTVKVDGSKYTIGLKMGMEYKIGNGDWIDVTKAHADEKGKVSSIKLFDLYTAYESKDVNSKLAYNPDTAVIIYVRTSATEKLIASKTATIQLLAAADASNVARLDDGTTDNDLLSVAYKKSYDSDSGLNITNSTKYDYQFAIVDKTDANITTDGTIDPIKIANNSKIFWTTVKAAVYNDEGTKMERSRIGTISGSKYDDIEKDNRILIYRLASIKENTKTSAIEFRVASKADSSGFNGEKLALPTVKTQAITLSEVDGITLTAPTEANKYYTIEVTGTDVAKSFEPVAILSNPSLEAGAAPKVVSVASAEDTAKTERAPSGVKIVANGKLNEASGKLKITLAKNLEMDSVSYWRVTAESATIYIKLIVTAPIPEAPNLAVTLTAGASGKTKVTATAGSGNGLIYVISDNLISGVKVGDAVAGITINSGDEVEITVGKYITVYEVDASGKAVKYNSQAVTAEHIG